MKFYVAVAMLAIGLPTHSWAQAIISGLVKDIENDLPLAGAHVVMEHVKNPSITDSLGRFTIEYNGSNPHSLMVSYVGYETLVVPVESSKSKSK